MTISDAFPAPSPAADVSDSVGRRSTGRAHMYMRARGYRSLPVVGKIGAFAAVAGADLRSAWWTPTSLPTVQRAWAQRIPDRDRVPGNNAALYVGWLVHNHTVGLLVPALVVAAVGALSPLAWVALHPARTLLAAVLLIPVVILILS